jgi:hypothetical protein
VTFPRHHNGLGEIQAGIIREQSETTMARKGQRVCVPGSIEPSTTTFDPPVWKLHG